MSAPLHGVSRETVHRLNSFAALAKRWSPGINLVSRSSLDHIWERHVIDSAQLWGLAPHRGSWWDLGAGGGFPGVVIAILAEDAQEDLRVTLVESDARKGAFLHHVRAALGLNLEVRTARIEHCGTGVADIVSARALAPLCRLLQLATPVATKPAVMLFPKGRSFRSELTDARRSWHIEFEAVASQTDPDSVILKITKAEPRA